MEQLKPSQENNIENFDNWVKPDISKEGGEFLRTVHSFYDSGFESNQDFIKEIKDRYQKTDIKELDLNLWNILENTDSINLKRNDWYSLQNKLEDRRDWRTIKNSFESGGKMESPIVAELPNGIFHLVSGNTRLCLSKIIGIIPKVIIVKFPKEGFKG